MVEYESSKAQQIQEQTEIVMALGVLAFVAMVFVAVIYQTAASLWGTLPATAGTAVVGIAAAFTFAVSKNVRKSVLDWSKEIVRQQ